MSDSDSDVPMVRVKSIEGFKLAPEDIEFLIKMKPLKGQKKGFAYKLKKKQTLPYSPYLEGDCTYDLFK